MFPLILAPNFKFMQLGLCVLMLQCSIMEVDTRWMKWLRLTTTPARPPILSLATALAPQPSLWRSPGLITSFVVHLVTVAAAWSSPSRLLKPELRRPQPQPQLPSEMWLRRPRRQLLLEVVPQRRRRLMVLPKTLTRRWWTLRRRRFRWRNLRRVVSLCLQRWLALGPPPALPCWLCFRMPTALHVWPVPFVKILVLFGSFFLYGCSIWFPKLQI